MQETLWHSFWLCHLCNKTRIFSLEQQLQRKSWGPKPVFSVLLLCSVQVQRNHFICVSTSSSVFYLLQLQSRNRLTCLSKAWSKSPFLRRINQNAELLFWLMLVFSKDEEEKWELLRQENLGGGGGGWCRDKFSGFKISPWNRNGGDPGALTPQRAAGAAALLAGNSATLVWHLTPMVLAAHSSLRSPWSAFLHRSPPNISVRKQVGPNGEVKIFPIFFKSYFRFEKKKKALFVHKTCHELLSAGHFPK